jgi:hypothetical protein
MEATPIGSGGGSSGAESVRYSRSPGASRPVRVTYSV